MKLLLKDCTNLIPNRTYSIMFPHIIDLRKVGVEAKQEKEIYKLQTLCKIR
jgi:hypothetical protein